MTAPPAPASMPSSVVPTMVPVLSTAPFAPMSTPLRVPTVPAFSRLLPAARVMLLAVATSGVP